MPDRSESESPVLPYPAPIRRRTNLDWWPNQLNLQVLHQHSPLSNPMGEDFNYAEELETLDFDALKQDIFGVMTTSQEWWPARCAIAIRRVWAAISKCAMRF